MNLLIEAGVDKVLSLRSINEETILQIEQFLTANKQIVNKLNCCYSEWYKQQECFQFLPGHRTIILAIPNQIKEMLAGKSLGKSHLKQNEVSDEELKNHLIKNLLKFTGKIGFPISSEIVSQSNLHDFERGSIEKYVAKVRFSCPFCNKSFSVVYKQFWMSSNVTKHLKTHITSETQNTV